MRFIMIVKPPPYDGRDPEPDQLAAMGRYNDELRRAGVLLDVMGLEGTDKGARITFEGTKRSVVDGPFSEAKEVIGGFWVIEVSSKAEALEWAKRIPLGTEVHPGHRVEVELRQVSEIGRTR